jgi:hypothetical protein
MRQLVISTVGEDDLSTMEIMVARMLLADTVSIRVLSTVEGCLRMYKYLVNSQGKKKGF